MDSFIKSLQQERTLVQARLKLLDELIASYVPASPPQPGSEQPRSSSKTSNGHARPESKASKVRRMTAELLTREGRVHRKMILDHLKSAGVMGNERDPMGQLAAYLTANKDLFSTDGNGNFILRQS